MTTLRFFFISTAVLAVALSGSERATAQNSFEEYQTKLNARFNSYSNRINREYEDYRLRINERYADALRNKWERMNLREGEKRPKEPTPMPPVIAPTIPTVPAPVPKPIAVDPEPVSPPKVEPQPEPVKPIQDIPKIEVRHSFVAFGTKMDIRWDSSLKFRLSNIAENNVSSTWKRLSDSKYNSVIVDMLDIRSKYRLDDWAYLNTIDAFSRSVMGDTDEATILTAYIYCQSGYRIRLARGNGRLVMLFASKHLIYDIPSLTIGSDSYYPFNYPGTEICVCNISFPGEQSLSLVIREPALLAQSNSDGRTLSSTAYPEMKIKTTVNKNLIEYYNTYPTSLIDNQIMSRWAMYANTPLSYEAHKSLYTSLQSAISGLGELDAVERLLNWTQTAFIYRLDDEVWGQDRAFFAEETLFYPYADCEDRAILFSRMVRDLLGLDVILVYYPGHLATAVRFNSGIHGDYITLSGRNYTVCDPTYINAKVGQTMPAMDNATAKVILLD